ncbi:hypothetical protein [Pedobacter miscanthi]|uniref:hypothetical protein n=1 Tax=Pedobacter miscanthi TaxID=2259170 RepID=UPI00292D76A1|nr:hypothetical protein [Pedobacter miscanthi]
MNNNLIKICGILFFFFVLACSRSPKNEKRIDKGSKINHGVISIPDVLKSDIIADDFLLDFKCVELKGYQAKENTIDFKHVKITGNQIYLLDVIQNKFYCFSQESTLRYVVDLSKYKTEDNLVIEASSFFIANNEITFIDTGNRIVATFKKDKLKDIKKISFWASEGEFVEKNAIVIYQGYVNSDFGTPYYFVQTDSNFKVEKRYLPVAKDENEASLRTGTVANHIFKTDNSCNLLIDQENAIYKYPDFSKPAYKVDFAKYNFNLLKAISQNLPSPSNYNFARISTFWESNDNIVFSYFLQKEMCYTVYNKKSKQVLNRFGVRNFTDFMLYGLHGNHQDFFYLLVEPDQLNVILKSNQTSFLESFTKQLPGYNAYSKNAVLVLFKLRNF